MYEEKIHLIIESNMYCKKNTLLNFFEDNKNCEDKKFLIIASNFFYNTSFFLFKDEDDIKELGKVFDKNNFVFISLECFQKNCEFFKTDS